MRSALQLSVQKYLAVCTLAALLLVVAPARVQAVVYEPGTTLNPSCLPTDVNCYVRAPITGTTATSTFQTPIEAQDTIKLSATSTPTDTSARLYNVGSVLYWNGAALGIAGAGITSLNSIVSSSQTFATSSSDGLSFNISSVNGVHTFTSSLASGYSIPLTASSTNWNSFFDTPSTRITAGSGLSWSTNTLAVNTGALTLASASADGIVSTTTQSFAGDKTFTGTTALATTTATALSANTFSLGSLSGLLFGTAGSVGTTSLASLLTNSLSWAGNTLTSTINGVATTTQLSYAGAAADGLLSTTTQTFAGDKTLTGTTTLAITNVGGLLTATGGLLWNAPYTTATMPSASTYHGMFAHNHDTANFYGSHAGNWLRLVHEDTSNNTVLSGNLTVASSTALATTSATGLTLSQNGLILASSTPATTTQALYSLGNTLYWNGSAMGSSALSSLSAATAANIIDNLNFTQTWNWSTLANGAFGLVLGKDIQVNGINIGRGLGQITSNTAVGVAALDTNTSGVNNTAIGNNALTANTNGAENTAVGNGVLIANSAGGRNTAIGHAALSSNTASDNTSVGHVSLYYNTSGSYNTAMGRQSLVNNTSGSYNTAIGFQSGMVIAGGTTANQTSTNSLYLGALTKALANGDTNEIVIGYDALGNGSNSVTLGSTTIAKTILQGNVGIGATSPTNKLHVEGGITIGSSTPATTTSALYNLGNTLYWNGSAVGGALAYASSTADGIVSTTTQAFAGDKTFSGLLSLATTTASKLFTASEGIAIASSTPISAINTLYNLAGALYWNGTAVGSASSTNVLAEYGENTSITNGGTFTTTLVDIAGSSFTLPSAGTWEVEYNIFNTHNIGASAVSVGIYDSSNVLVANSQSISASITSSAQSPSNSNVVRITTTGSATYKLRVITSAGTGTIVNSGTGTTASGNSKITWNKIAGNAAVTGQSVDYAYALLGSNTAVGAGAAIPFASSTVGNIPNTAGVFTLTAGKTYRLAAQATMWGTSGTTQANFQWRDITNNTLIGPTVNAPSVQLVGDYSPGAVAEVIYTPTTNVTVRVESLGAITYAGTAGNRQSWVSITQLGTTATTEYQNNILGDFATGGAIMASTLSEYTNHIQVAQTTTAQTLSIPSPTNTALSRIVYIDNTGTANFQMHGVTVGAGETNAFKWNGTTWKSFGAQANNVAAEYGEYVLTATTLAGASSFSDFPVNQQFTIPTAGTWEVAYDIHANPSDTPDAYYIRVVDVTGGNVAVTNSLSTGLNSSAGISVVSNIFRVTTAGATTYKIQGKQNNTLNGLSIVSDNTSATSKVTWKKISGFVPVTGQSVDFFSSNSAGGGVSGGTVTWSSIQGNLAYSAGDITLLAGKTYRIYLHDKSGEAGGQRTLRNVTTSTSLATTVGAAGASTIDYTLTTSVNTVIRFTNASGSTFGSGLLNITQLGSSAFTAGTALNFNSLAAAIATGALDNTNFGQTWDWSTLTTGTGLAMSANALTTGSLQKLTTSSTALVGTSGITGAGSLLDLNATGAATAFVGNLANIQNTGLTAVGNTGTALNINLLGTAQVMKALKITDASTGDLGAVAGTGGGIQFNFTGGHTGHGVQVDDATLAGTAMRINANALTTGTGLDILTSNASLASTNGFFRVANTGANTGTTPFVRLQPNSTAGSGLTLTDDGNVGIGTTTPSTNLHVFQNADVWHGAFGGATGELRIGGQTGSGAVIQARTSAGVARDLYLQRDGGNVGIGTAAPTAKLHLYDSTTVLRLQTSSGSGSTAADRYIDFVGANGVRTGYIGDANAGDAHMLIASDAGNVGVIGTGGVCYLTGGASGGSCFSDSRLKTVTGGITNTLDGLSMLELNTFYWNDTAHEVNHASTTILNTGFIAQQVEQVFPELVYTNTDGYKTLDYSTLSLYGIVGLKELNTKVEGLAFENATTTDAEGNKTFVGRFFDRMVAWFADKANGIGNFFAERVHTKQICVEKSDGSEYCLTGDELEAVVPGGTTTQAPSNGTNTNTSTATTTDTGTNMGTGTGAGDTATTTTSTTPDTEAPVLTLVGGNETLIVGNTYTEQGATAVDNSDGDITASIVTTGVVDITTAGTYTITYTVSDAAGNEGFATRTVTVNEPAPAPAPEPTPDTVPAPTI